jgi:hypothetical protein
MASSLQNVDFDQVEFVDENVDYSHRICVTDVVVKALGKQSALSAMLTLNERFMGNPALTLWAIIATLAGSSRTPT